MSALSTLRIWKLMRLEFLLHRKFYSMLMIGAFLLTLISMLLIWYQYFDNSRVVNSHLEAAGSSVWIWENGAYQGVFLTFKVLILFLVIAQSFKGLRTRSSAEFFLLLPATVLEKLIAQIILLVGLAELLLPFLFWLAIRLAKLIWIGVIEKVKGFEANIDISVFELTFFLPNIQDQHWSISLFLYGITLLVTSWFFLGSLYFGKWNVVFSPLTMFLTYLILAGSSIGLSKVLIKNEANSLSFDISLNEPEIFPDVPLIMLVLILLLYSGSFLSYVIAYFKLKEREV